ncbi:RraA family protein [Fredinandcohnia sp. 179-A 10B2 NHS]|uniref:RraA family protein n=1 Tax=Fredinandcohnia sp. 179-A 10B2 NHS TaxID=3235176 RepID=UPI0039A14577
MSQVLKRPSKELIEGFKEVSTPNVSDALDKLGLKSGVCGIRPLYDCEKIVGPAITMKVIPYGPDVPKGHMGADALDAAEPGDIIVIDNGGRTDQNCWGEILAFAAQQIGVSGVIIDGAARDIDIISEIKFPVYAKGTVPFTARGRNVQGGFNCTIQVAGAQVRPVDIIMADVNGVVVIPLEHAEEVLRISKEIFDRELEIVRLLKAGIPFSEVDRQSGYDKMLEKK